MSGYNTQHYMLFDVSQDIAVSSLDYVLDHTLNVAENDREGGALANGPSSNYVKFDMSFARFLDCIDTSGAGPSVSGTTVTDAEASDANVFKFDDTCPHAQDGRGGLDYALDFNFAAVHMEIKNAVVSGEDLKALDSIQVVGHGLLNGVSGEDMRGLNYSIPDLTITVWTADTPATSANELSTAEAAESSTKVVQWAHGEADLTAYKADNLAAVDDIQWDQATSTARTGDDTLSASLTLDFSYGQLDVTASINSLSITSTQLTLYLQTLLEENGEDPAVYDFNGDATEAAADITSFRNTMQTAFDDNKVKGIVDKDTVEVDIPASLNGVSATEDGDIVLANGQGALVWSMNTVICFN